MSDFYLFWFVIELSMLSFIGLSYSLFNNSYSSLMVYFLIQAASSFSILVCYSLSVFSLFLLFLLLKLSMFPFHSWFLSVVYSFPSLPLLLVSSLHKFPSFLLISLFLNEAVPFLLSVSCLFSLLLSGSLMLIASDFRVFILSSSVGNNSWLILASLHSSTLVLLFLVIYSLGLTFVVTNLGGLSNLSLSLRPAMLLLFIGSLVFISGFPPFPLFWVKLLVIYLNSSFFSPFFIFSFLLTSCLALAGYFKFCLAIVVSRYSFHF